MKRLILSEIKKIFKRKSTMVLIVLLTLLTCFMTNMGYHNSDASKTGGYGSIANLDGKSLNKVEAAQYMDDVLHRYAGEFTKEKYNEMKDDFIELVNKNYSLALDEKKMQKIYGKDYQKLVDMSLNNELNEHNIYDYVEDDQFYAYEDVYHIYMYYENESILNGIIATYTGKYFEYENLDINKLDEFFDEGSIGKMYKVLTHQDIVSQDNSMDHLDEKPLYFDSTIPQNMYYNVLNFIVVPLFFPAIFVIMIILSNVFGIEKYYHTDQIIYPTKYTKSKITFAKWIASFIVGIGVMWLQFLTTLVVSYMILPMHSLNMLPVTMGISQIDTHYMVYTYLEMFIIVLVLLTISAIAVTTLTLLLSYFMVSNVSVLIIMFVFLISYFFTELFSGQGNIMPTWISVMHPHGLLQFSRYLICDFNLTSWHLESHMISIGNMSIFIWCIVASAWILISGCSIWLTSNHAKKYV